MNLKSTLFIILFLATGLKSIAQDPCVCPEVFAPVCGMQTIDGETTYLTIPNACLAECLGFTIVEDSLCVEGNPWGDCNCPLPDSTFVCATDGFGFTYQVPSACYAECWGLTVVADSLCNSGGGNPWGDCDCTFDEDEPFICAVDSLGHPCQVPNACFAACWGLTVVDDSECSNIGEIDPELDLEFITCLDSLIINENTLFQEVLLMLSENCGMELPSCIVDAPIFPTDSAFITYIINNCDTLGFNDNPNSNVMNMYNMINSTVSSTQNPELNLSTSLSLAINPTSNNITYFVESKNSTAALISLIDLNGKTILSVQHQLSEGKNMFKDDISQVKGGLYMLNMKTNEGQQTVKVLIVE